MIKPYYETSLGKLYHGSCEDIMPELEPNIDMVCCDPPYGTTACSWDSIIPLEPMWEQLKRLIKANGAIALFGSEPFSSALRMSNVNMYKYDWIWNKKLAGNGILAKRQPLKIHEIVSIFNSGVYNPQKTKGKFRKKMGLKESEITGGASYCKMTENNEYYPVSIQEFGIGNMRIGRLHPTQKPVALMEYLIKTYTNEGETVLDFACGSGTTAIAAERLNRKWIGIEKELKYVEISSKRIEAESRQLKLFR